MTDLVLLLSRQVDHAIANAYAPNTLKSRRSQCKRYLAFCTTCGLAPFPISSNQLCLYIAFLGQSLKYSSLCNYVDGLQWFCDYMGYSSLPRYTPKVKMTLRGFKRLLGTAVKQKLPITPSILLSIRQHLQPDDIEHSALWAAFLVGFFTFFRKSNLVPPSVRKFNADLHLTRRDFTFTDWGMVITVRWSKTIQFRNKILLIPVAAISGHPLCPVHAVQSYFSKYSASVDGPAFTYPNKQQHRFITYSHFTKSLHNLFGEGRI